MNGFATAGFVRPKIRPARQLALAAARRVLAGDANPDDPDRDARLVWAWDGDPDALLTDAGVRGAAVRVLNAAADAAQQGA